MMKHYLKRTERLPVVAILVLLASILVLTGCSPVSSPSAGAPEQPDTGTEHIDDIPDAAVITPLDTPRMPARGFYTGILPTPGEGQDFEDVYAQAAQFAEFVPVWGRPTPYYRLAQDLSGSWGKTFVTQLIRGSGMFPLVHVSFMSTGLTLASPPGMANASLSNSEWRASYKQAIIDIVRASGPRYLSAGNEVNRWYEKYGIDKNNPDGFQHYISLYEEIYDEVKNLSPQTMVFCTFSREIVSEYREADIDVLELFDPEKLDVLVLTSYPHAVQGINKPSDIPDTYYADVAALMPGKRFGFSELGWPSIDAFGGKQGQSDFLAQAAGRLTTGQGIKLHLLGWAWLHDLENGQSIGLIKRDGTEKPAYQTWKSISAGN